MGTGDGRLPLAWAREQPERLFIGLDANAAGLRQPSGRAARERRTNVVYVRAAAEALPAELAGIADRVTVVLPWGSLLSAVALPSVEALSGASTSSRPTARADASSAAISARSTASGTSAGSRSR